MKHVMVIFAIVLMGIVIGCGGQTPQDQTQAQPKQVDYAAITALLSQQQMEYAQAWNNKDMNKIGQIWANDDDITIWGPAVRDRVQGWEGPNGVKAWYEGAMGSMDTVDFKIHDLLIKVSTDGTAAVVTYYVENDFVDIDGNKGKMTPRVTVVKELRDGQWKQIHGDASYSIEEVEAMQQ